MDLGAQLELGCAPGHEVDWSQLGGGGGGESGVRRVYVRLLRTALLQDAENKNCSGLV